MKFDTERRRARRSDTETKRRDRTGQDMVGRRGGGAENCKSNGESMGHGGLKNKGKGGGGHAHLRKERKEQGTRFTRSCDRRRERNGGGQ